MDVKSLNITSEMYDGWMDLMWVGMRVISVKIFFWAVIAWFIETGELYQEERWWIPFHTSVVECDDRIPKGKCTTGNWRWIDGGSWEKFKFEMSKFSIREIVVKIPWWLLQWGSESKSASEECLSLLCAQNHNINQEEIAGEVGTRKSLF